ncbi:MAG: hypothetical protein AAFP03_11715 [Cyanobacteria bacterium J06598_3]
MGLFEFVFGKGAPKDDTQGKGAYYLSDDDAKSFGDIEYMRSVKTVKRTFAKRKGETEHMESVRQISATKMSSVDGNSNFAAPQASVPAASTTESTSAPAPSVPTTPRRTAASSNDMDLFRNMAKKIKK